MNQQERQDEILTLVRSGRCTNVKELSHDVFASPATIRRDLHILQSQGLVRLQYGNVVPLTDKPAALPLAFRENEAKKTKILLAKHAAGMIKPESRILLDASSSAMYLADHIDPSLNVTVFTNCIKTVVRLCERNITVYLIGGKVDSRNYVTEGSWTEENAASIHVDYFFFSSKAMDSEGMISGESEAGVKMRRLMIKQADYSYFLCNSEKIGNHSTFNLCNASELTGVITDGDLDFLPGVNAIKISV